MNEATDRQQITPEDLEMTLNTLAKLHPGLLPLSIFHEVARLTVTPILEVVPLRTNADGNTEVLLAERDASDPIWAGMLHAPGTVIRANDINTDNNEAFNRIIEGELQALEVSSPVFVENLFHRVKRGAEQAQVYYVEVIGEPKNGKLYSTDKLPLNITDSQVLFIQDAVKLYKNSRQN